MFDHERIESLVATFKQDQESVYNTWFIDNDARLKAFGAIRRGVEQVIEEIKGGVFPNDFKGSSLEVVLSAITEQKQVFEGAAHAFYWKPKLRIPDIYENEAHKRAFGQFLESALGAGSEQQILSAIARLDGQKIKGLGPAVANILYFLHPTLFPPSNTAILKGFNVFFGEKQKLGSWDGYLHMRDAILSLNADLGNRLSKDLGAVTGLLFEIGAGKIVLDENLHLVDETQRKQWERMHQKRHRQVHDDRQEKHLHDKMQHMLLTIGHDLGYDVFVAANDRSKTYADEKFSSLSIPELPAMPIDDAVHKKISLIDAIWLAKDSSQVVCAFEVEVSTSINSGMLRLIDLLRAIPQSTEAMLYLVAPDDREKKVLAELHRPWLTHEDRGRISYILFSDLTTHCDSICKLGHDHSILRNIARCAC